MPASTLRDIVDPKTSTGTEAASADIRRRFARRLLIYVKGRGRPT